MEILLLTAPLQERIWGGDYFKKLGRTDNESIGELWSASAHPNGESTIINGKLKGKTLSYVYKNYPHFFNNPTLDKFPILVKLINTKQALSVQVHPQDEYAKKYENQYGKTEGWLILAREKDSTLVIGHHAKNEAELRKYIENDDYENLLKTVKINPGEFYPIYAGEIHAIGAGVTLLEIQQSSDVTYRLYDYHRKDSHGHERELHVEKAIAVTTYGTSKVDRLNHFNLGNHMIWENDYFKVSLLEVKGQEVLLNPLNYSIFTVVEGNLLIDGHQLVIGDSFILTKIAKKVKITGNGKLIKTDA